MCEMAKVYNEDRVRARKPHKCCECRLPIVVGEEYMRCSGLWDGWETFRQHLHCYHFARRVNSGYEMMPSGIEHCYSPSTVVPYSGDQGKLVDFNRKTMCGHRCDPFYSWSRNDDCIGFGDIKSSLCDIDDELVGLWDAMISGISEAFELGDGI